MSLTDSLLKGVLLIGDKYSTFNVHFHGVSFTSEHTQQLLLTLDGTSNSVTFSFALVTGFAEAKVYILAVFTVPISYLLQVIVALLFFGFTAKSLLNCDDFFF